MIINNVEFEFDSTSLESLQKLEDANVLLEDVKKKGEELTKTGKIYEFAKLQIEAVRDFFIEITGKDVVGEDCNNYVLATAFVEDFNKQCAEQRDKIRHNYFATKRR